jgi:ubiquitin C-terminal hydrolase
VKSHNLLDSLEQFVKGELLEGDNAYFCEECGVKVGGRISLIVYFMNFYILVISPLEKYS